MLFLLCYLACAAAYLLLAGMIIIQTQRSVVARLLCAASVATAVWAIATAFWGASPDSPASLFDLARAAAWYAVVLHLYRRAVADARQARLFVGLGLGLLAAGAVMLLGQSWSGGSGVTLFSAGIPLRLLLAVGQLILLENLYRSTTPELRWYVGLGCVALAGLAMYDLALIGDAVLSHRLSLELADGRAVVAILVAPLLAVSAARNRAWGVTLHASRTAVFHTAALMGSGVFLLSLGAVAELLKRASWAPNSDWTGLSEVVLIFSGLIAIAVLLTSTSIRNWLTRLVAEHFFTFRYDYRREWLRCIATLSGGDGIDPDGLQRRAIQAVADVVDSPAGVLLSGQGGQGQADQAGFSWMASWNLPALGALPHDHPLLDAMKAGVCFEAPEHLSELPPLDQFRLWLAVPLPGRGGNPADWILLAPPRGPFRLDEEVFALLGVLAREVATHLAEQRAARALVETRDLRAYAERFAFVAHDIKNVAGQLRLLTDNAERHLANPAFQRDMLATIGASVHKIGNLIRRLETTEGGDGANPPRPEPLDLLPRIEAALAVRRQPDVQQADVQLAPPGKGDFRVGMTEMDLDAVLTHLLDNAGTAAGPTGKVRLAVREERERVVLDIADDGPGMTPEFIRDELFRPFRSNTAGGSGIGAFQARELLRRAGGDLLVMSRPGKGTTMQLLLPRPGSARPGSTRPASAHPASAFPVSLRHTERVAALTI